MDKVILVDQNDNEIGLMDKLEVHQKGLLHRAFSILLFNDRGEWLIQKRSATKYHCAGLWSNTCCSHPKPNELIMDAANRRLLEELNISANLQYSHSFIYKADMDNNLIEHEYDHVLIGTFNENPLANKAEIEDLKYISLSDLKSEIQKNPEQFTYWLKWIVQNWSEVK